MDEYKKIYEVYKQQLNEASFSYGYGNADQPKLQLAKFKGAKSDYKNSTAINTASLPGGTKQVNLAGMGSSADMSNEDEEIEIKGYGKMAKKDLRKLHKKLKDEIKPKLEMLNTLAKHLQ